jgi:hypothetical protein
MKSESSENDQSARERVIEQFGSDPDAGSHYGSSRTVTNAKLIEIVTEVYEAGIRDAGQGGAKREEVAERAGLSEGTVQERMRSLERDGFLEKVYGLGPDGTGFRNSYRPVQDDGDDGGESSTVRRLIG